MGVETCDDGNVDNNGDNEAPASVGDIDLGDAAVQLSAGTYHTCARMEGGAIRCWGNGGYGRLGYGNTDNIGDDDPPRQRRRRPLPVTL